MCVLCVHATEASLFSRLLSNYVAAISTWLLLVVHMMSVTLVPFSLFMQTQVFQNITLTVSVDHYCSINFTYILCTSVWFSKRRNVVRW